MSGSFDTVFAGGTVVTPNGREQVDVGVRDGRIAAIGDLIQASASEVVDCRGLHILPGVIDSQVHFREPGLEHKEDLETGARAAVLGGVTGVFEMPNTSPTTTSAAALDDKLRRASGRMSCDYAFWVGATAENIDALADLEKLPGAAGIKIFMGSSTGTLLVEDDPTLDRVMRAISRRCAVHAEDEPRLRERKDLRVPGDPTSHPVWRDPTAALMATRRLVGAARKAGRRVHVLHISTAEEMDYLADQKDVATLEVTPNHLTLAIDEDGERLGTLMQMNPPVRDAAHRARIWQAVRDGLVDVLGSDHAPHTREEKANSYPESPSGMPGVQTLVPVMLDHVAKGRLTLERFVDLTSAGPQRIFGISRKGRIALGYDADLTIVDLKRTETISNDWIATKAGWTPYDGLSVTGWPVGTIVRGIKVMWEGDLVNPGEGAPISFVEALPAEG
ncbi:dihydroorotase [Amorphus sp. 3PC139-8]|uniref:dihydroorotase n=1 Tax=Amorphus sp. 3PC139-8 TaxID=2735676 RepID=UPI00345D27E4